MTVKLFTIGHSTQSREEFLNVLKKFKINQLIDIRTIPRSRHNPQFNRDTFSKFLRNHHINYRHMKGLGGLRRARKDSINTGWHNASFRGFADYTQTTIFKKNLETLITLADKKTVAIMCAEAVPWRCHRSLIGDALLARKINVYDIIGKKKRKHALTSFAKIIDHYVIYPAKKR